MKPQPSLSTARLIEAMKAKGVNQSQLARELGLTPGAIQQIVSGMTKKSKHVPDIARYLGVGIDWLLGNDIPPGQVISSTEVDFVQLTEVDIGYGMGGGTFIDEDADAAQAIFDPRWLANVTRSPPNMLFVAHGLGDSMMPTLLDNDTLLVDRGQKQITQQDRIWALTYGDLGMIKRVRRLPSGGYLLMSDNAAISPIEATGDEIHVVGRIVWIGRKA